MLFFKEKINKYLKGRHYKPRVCDIKSVAGILVWLSDCKYFRDISRRVSDKHKTVAATWYFTSNLFERPTF